MAKEDKSYPKVKAISFVEEYEKEYSHVCKQKNASAYVCKLIRMDMSGKFSDKDLDIDDKIQHALKEHLANILSSGSSLPTDQAPPKIEEPEEEVEIEEDIIDDDILEDYV